MPRTIDIPHICKPLLPLAWLYSAGVWVRNQLFDRRILPVEEFSIPVISVGNLTVGGTGKTPMIEYLIELISPHRRVAVLSRGYRRKSKGFVVATAQTTALDIGDEPYQIHCKYNNLIVAVDSNRRRGIKQLLALSTPPEVILLDDAHQHRYVLPSLSIVLCDYNRPIYADLPLPAGRLREPHSGLRRAHIVVLTKTPHALTQQEIAEEAKLLHISHQELYAAHIEYQQLHHITDASRHDIASSIAHRPVILFTGIANPMPMMQYIERYTSHITCMTYPDHHDFSTNELNELSQRAQREDAVIITTEKDAARLNHIKLPEEVAKHCYILPMKTALQPTSQAIDFDNLILQKIGINQ